MAQALLRGLWLDEQEDIRYAMLMECNDNPWEQEFRVEVAVPKGDQAERFAKALLDQMIKAGDSASTHRGRVLTPRKASSHYETALDLQRVPLDPVTRDDVIMDHRTFELFDMNTLGFVAQAKAMAKLGFSGRKGVLLYGPPGTGKTLLVRYLVSQLDGYTRFILTPESFGFFGEIMEAARKMLPALIVIEDADLIAEDRNECAPGASGLLNQLLNEMDGLTVDAPILFILTTNRPEVLEPALASRPGRIDQAIEIGLPAEHERRLLLARFAKSVGLSEEITIRVSRDTGDVSPAFLKELVRRAAQGMLIEHETKLAARHFEDAMKDMVKGGGKVGAQLVGGKGMGFL
ncbi:MAG: ATP-binding protein [Rhodocyclales bacterium]|nr:ATP-binding protein [Rhodocyclales bacterium]